MSHDIERTGSFSSHFGLFCSEFHSQRKNTWFITSLSNMCCQWYSFGSNVHRNMSMPDVTRKASHWNCWTVKNSRSVSGALGNICPDVSSPSFANRSTLWQRSWRRWQAELKFTSMEESGQEATSSKRWPWGPSVCSSADQPCGAWHTRYNSRGRLNVCDWLFRNVC